ncbi:MAG: hypothetical protein ACPG47_04570 [Leucothrix sp.]
MDEAEQEKIQQEKLIKAVTEVPSQTFDEGGLSFEYAEGWKITGDDTQDSVRYIFVQGPKDAVSIIQQYPLANAPTLEAFSNSYSEETQVIPVALDGDTAEASPTVVAQSEFMYISRDLEGTPYDWVVERVPGVIGGVQVSDYREYFRKDSEKFATFLINQVSNDVITELEGSFELIFKTLKAQP